MTATTAADTTGLWIRRFEPRPDAAVRLVCFPHAGASAVVYRPWASAADPSIELLAVQYPGRQDRYREPGIGSLAELADQVLPAVRAAVGDQPFALFGHSLGAALAFEVTRRLGAERRPELLVASGRRAPSRPRDEAYHTLDDRGLTAHLQKLAGTDPRLLSDPETRELILRAIRPDLQAAETHHCPADTAVDVPLLALTGDDDPWTTLPEASAWSTHTTREFDLQVFGGGHFYLAERQDEILRILAARLLGRNGS